MTVETIDITDISQDPANVRKHSRRNLDAIKASLRAFGQQKPIVVDDRNVILAGNGTYEAAKELGWSEIQIVRTRLTGTSAVAYAIADNRTAELAEWDDTALAEQLRALQSEEFDVEAAGFTGEEINGLIEKLSNDLLGSEPKEIIEDEAPEPPADPITKPGDLWILGEHRLLCGDSTKAEDVERLMAGAKADLCFTSPPYNLGKSVGLRNGFRKGLSSAYNDSDDNLKDWKKLFKEFTDIALSHSLLVAINVQMLSGNKVALCELIGEYASRIVDTAIWVKTNPQPAMAEQVMSSAFEFIFMLSPELNPTRRISSASFLRGSFSNVFLHGTAAGHDSSIHGAIFPLSVAMHYVANLSKDKDTIYEPFCGSGTTLIAAEQLGRKCYGMEISPQYCDVIVKRWETLTGKVATRENHRSFTGDAA
jgi:DNA modification methylase